MQIILIHFLLWLPRSSKSNLYINQESKLICFKLSLERADAEKRNQLVILGKKKNGGSLQIDLVIQFLRKFWNGREWGSSCTKNLRNHLLIWANEAHRDYFLYLVFAFYLLA